MAVQSLVWEGKALTERMRAAQRAGIDATMGQAVIQARRNHPWQNQTGDLTRSIQIVRPARVVDDFVIGQWGSTDLAYALILEIGGTIRPKKAKFLAVPVTDAARKAGSPRNMPGLVYVQSVKGQPMLVEEFTGKVQYILKKLVTIPAHPYLRPAADAIYPNLAGNIRKAWERFKPGSSPQGGSDA
jgi:hypothetical protein